MALETDRTIVIPDAGLRASDAERRDCTEALSAHFVEGRLDRAEFDERIGAAMAAKTRGELAGLLADLPRLPRPEAPGPRTWSRFPLFVLAGILFVGVAFSSMVREGQPAFHNGLSGNPGLGTSRIIVQSSHSVSVLPFLILAGVVLLVVCAVAFWRSPRGLDRQR